MPDATCLHVDCTASVLARGRCGLHYQRELLTDPTRPRCTRPDCTKPSLARGLCGMHYKRWQQHGDPDHVTVLRAAPPAERFALYVPHLDVESCWPWQGAILRDGYGMFAWLADDLKHLRAHAAAVRLDGRTVPPGMSIDHACHNRALAIGSCVGGETCQHRRCVNPTHLDIVTPTTNQRRRRDALHALAARAFTPTT